MLKLCKTWIPGPNAMDSAIRKLRRETPRAKHSRNIHQVRPKHVDDSLGFSRGVMLVGKLLCGERSTDSFFDLGILFGGNSWATSCVHKLVQRHIGVVSPSIISWIGRHVQKELIDDCSNSKAFRRTGNNHKLPLDLIEAHLGVRNIATFATICSIWLTCPPTSLTIGCLDISCSQTRACPPYQVFPDTRDNYARDVSFLSSKVILLLRKPRGLRNCTTHSKSVPTIVSMAFFPLQSWSGKK